MRKIFFGVFFLFSGFLFIPQTVSAGLFYPFYGWRTINTQHFSIHYHQDSEAVAKKAAGYFEEVYEKLTPQFHWKPWGKTEVILTDNNDESNGLASTLPYNWLLLRIVPPEPESSLSTYDDWLKLLITHEFTHILHLDAYGGFWKPWHYLFGKLIAPAGLTPNWVKEGMATLEETEETEGGRGRAAYSEMLVRTAILQNQFPSIDRADGLQWKWPAAQTQYIFGVKFLQYLEKRFGKEKLMEFNRVTQHSVLVSAVNHAAKKAFGESFYKLWREWQEDLRKEYAAWEETVKKEGITETEKFIEGKKYDSFYLPTFSKDGKWLAFVVTNPKRAPVLWLKDVETGKKKKVSAQIPSQISFAPDGESLIFSSVSTYKSRYRYYDLYRYDIKNEKLKRLTHGARAKDPDFTADGKKILFSASKNGTDTLKLYDVETKEITDLVLPPEPFTQFANMRYSPDGSHFAVVRFKNQVGWELAAYNSDGSFNRRITKTGLPVESRPTWTADGRFIIYSSDEDGVNNFYLYDWQTQTRKRLTRVTTGVFEPTLGEEGKTLLARYYNGEGYAIRKIPMGPWTMDPATLRTGRQRPETKKQKKESVDKDETDDSGHGEPVEPSTIHDPRKYSPFGKSLFLPRFVLPGFAFLDDGVLATAATGGNDPLRYHNWNGGISYRSGAGYLGYFGRYAYAHYLPILGVGINASAVDYGTLRFSTGNSYHFYEERRNTNGFISLPIGTRQAVGAAYFFENRSPITNILSNEAAALNLGHYAGFGATYVFGETEAYPASISRPEKGTKLRLSLIASDARLGSAEKNEQRVYMGDMREYLPLGNNHVIALRAAGGFAQGDRFVPGTFTLGGDLGEGTLTAPPGGSYFSLRGLPVAAFSGDRAMVLSGEYRLPIISPQHGPGTWPFFVENLHIGFFADYGDTWSKTQNDHNSWGNFFDKFMLGVGTELRGDFIVGHGLPITGRFGYAIIVNNRNRLAGLLDPITGSGIRNGIFILQFGTPF